MHSDTERGVNWIFVSSAGKNGRCYSSRALSGPMNYLVDFVIGMNEFTTRGDTNEQLNRFAGPPDSFSQSFCRVFEGPA